jgi:plastocyanin
MRRTALLVAAAAAPVVFALGCDSGRTTTPAVAAPNAVSLSRDGDRVRTQPVTLRDDCDPATFDAALGDPNACVRKGGGGLPFDRFVAELTRKQSVGAWKIDPDKLDADAGTILVATNRGGETHTFTHVAAFGGGIVGFLNDLAGTPNVAPECNPATLNFLTPGASSQTTVAGTGTELYQCCIHPWMRMEVHQHHS